IAFHTLTEPVCVRERRMDKSRTIFADILEKAMDAANTMERDELLFSYKGILYPVTLCSAEVFRAMESLEARSDDIILAGYPKSGTNWVGQILSDLVTVFEKKTQNKASSVNDEELEEFPYLEIGDTGKYERMNKLPSRRVILTHLLPENLPRSVFKTKAKILLLIRNPKDLATSFYHFSNSLSLLPSYETWNDFFTAFMTKKMPWGCYFEYLSRWNKYADDENIMTITYEELKENPVLGVKNIADFFGISLTDENLQSIVERSSFQSMKKNSQKTHGEFGKILFRKGGVSDWKNLFSEDQNEKMDKTFEEHVGGTKLGKKLKYERYCILEYGKPTFRVLTDLLSVLILLELIKLSPNTPISETEFHRDTNMSRNRERVIEIVENSFSQSENIPPEGMLFSYRGILYPVTLSSPETLEALKSFETRNDDVILAGYPKTGTNWLGQMVRELESTDAKYTEEEMKDRIDAEKKLETFPRLEFGDPGIYERMKKLPSRRIILTHLPPHLLPPSILQSKAKILVLVRNPKDTAVSYYHFYNNMPVLPSFASWDEYFAAFMNGKVAWGSYIDHLVEWNKFIDHERIMMITYEELKEDQVLGMERIADFFGFSLREEDFPRIAKKTSFQAMKEKSKETHGKFGDILFRKGVVGNWRDLFSKAQNEEMDQKFEDCLGGTKMAAKMKYDVYCKA
ncbi:uncharacterized protein O9250_000039, partial [Rhynochetos jubatus]